jgi:hypothetical protein
LPQPADCCECRWFSNPLTPSSYSSRWDCFPQSSRCSENQSLANGCVTSTTFQGIPICPEGYESLSVLYNDGICCPTPPPTPIPEPTPYLEGGGGGGPCTPYYWVTYWYWCPDGQKHVDGNCTYSHAEVEYAGCW